MHFKPARIKIKVSNNYPTTTMPANAFYVVYYVFANLYNRKVGLYLIINIEKGIKNRIYYDINFHVISLNSDSHKHLLSEKCRQTCIGHLHRLVRNYEIRGLLQ